MLRAVEDLPDVVGGHIAVALLVDLAPRLVDPGLAGGAGLTSDGLKEGVKVYEAVLLGVQVIQDNLRLALADADAVVAQAEVKLLLVQLAHTVMKQDVLERLGEASQSTHVLCVQV